MTKRKKETKVASDMTEVVDDEEADDGDVLPLARGPDFFKVYATRTVPYLTEFDIRIVLANETMGDDEGWCTVADGMVMLTPLAAKELATELDALVSAWEELHGKIRGRKGRRVVTTFRLEEG